MSTQGHQLVLTEHAKATCTFAGCRWKSDQPLSGETAKREIYSAWNRHLEDLKRVDSLKDQAALAKGVSAPAGPLERQRAIAVLPMVLPIFLKELHGADELTIRLPGKKNKVAFRLVQGRTLVVEIDSHDMLNSTLVSSGFTQSEIADRWRLLTKANDWTVAQTSVQISQLLESVADGPSSPVRLRYKTESVARKVSILEALDALKTPDGVTASDSPSSAPSRGLGKVLLGSLVAACVALGVLGVAVFSLEETPADSQTSTNSSTSQSDTHDSLPESDWTDSLEEDESEDAPVAEDEPDSSFAEANPISRDSDAAIRFTVTLQELDDTYKAMSRDDLLELGRNVCSLLNNGETVDSAIAAFLVLYEGDPMTVARLVSAANAELC